jgi:hypothetical protein
VERFFRTCSTIDEEEIIDLLLHRYGNLEYILQLDIETALRVIEKAREKEKENRYFLQWVVQLPMMDNDNFVSFDAYLDRVTGRNIDKRPVYECMAEIEEIKKMFK